MLSQAEIDSFAADGYVAVRGAVPADVLRLCQDEIWSALAERGVRRGDPSTWREPVVRIPCPESGPARRGPARRVPASPAPEPG